MKRLLIINIDETQDPEKWISDEVNYDVMFLNYSLSKRFLEDLLNLEPYDKMMSIMIWDVSHCNGGKWKNIYDVLKDYKELIDEYDYFWFPDPDLEMPINEINGYLDFVEGRKIGLSQPSLTKDSFCSHGMLKYREESITRHVPFVEVMCPCFEKSVLKELLWTFDQTHSGYGIDLLWAKFYRGVVIDMFQIRHPRKPQFAKEAEKRGWPDPKDELKMIQEKYNA